MSEPVGWKATEGPADYFDIIKIFLKVIDEEIVEIKKNGGDIKHRFSNGEFVLQSAGYYIYRFPIESDVYIDDDTPVNIVIGKSSIEGYIVSSNEESIDIAVKNDIGQTVKQVTVVNNLSAIFEALKNRYQEILSTTYSYNRSGCMELFGFNKPVSGNIQRRCLLENLNDEQRSAVEKALSEEVCFIWGPPGTGKTRTLSVILNNLMKMDRSVILTSHTNLAVDEALKKFAEDPENRRLIEDGRIIRYGTIANPDPLLKDFLIENIMNKKSKPLYDRIDQLGALISSQGSYKNRYTELIQMSEYYQIRVWQEELKNKLEFKNKVELELADQNNKRSEIDIEISSQENIIRESSKSIGNFIGYVFSNVNQSSLSRLKDQRQKIFENQQILYSKVQDVNGQTEEMTNAIFKLKGDLCNALKLNNINDIDNASEIIRKSSEIIAGYRSEIGDIQNQISTLRENIFKNALVIGCTLTKSYMDQKIYKRRFDVMILDEVSMANLPSAFFVGGLASQYIVSGDFRQLAAISKGDSELAKKWLRRDLFHQSGVIKSIEEGIDDQRIVILKEQFRMHPDIVSLINNKMYNGRLKTSARTLYEKEKITRLAPCESKATILCDTSTINPWCSITHSKSRINVYSAMLSVKMAMSALDSGIKSIGIITPYRSQAILIDNLLEERKIPKKVVLASTIHRFQGNEKECIIIDLVDGPPIENVGRLLREYAIDSDTSRLINVAVSRAKGKVIIIANYRYLSERLKAGNLVYDVISQIKEKGAVIDSNQILSSYYGITTDKTKNNDLEITSDNKIIQYNETGFYHAFTKDVDNAKSRIIIYSPFITRNRMSKLFNNLKSTVDRGVDVFLIIRSPEKNTGVPDDTQKLVDEIKRANIHVIYPSFVGLSDEFHEKFALIDNNKFYYGSLNILSQSTSTESMLAFTNVKTIEGLIKNLDVDNIIRRYNQRNQKPTNMGIKKYVDDDDKDSAYKLYSTACNLIKSQKYSEAITLLRTAISFNPNIAAYHYELGIAQCKNGAISDALLSVNFAVKLSPQNFQYQKALKIIEEKSE